MSRRPGRGGSRPGRGGGERHRGARTASTWSWSTRPASRATSAAATASPPARSACSSSSASTRRPCPSWQDVDAAWVRSPSGRVVEFPLPRGQGRFAAVAPRVDLDAALVDLARSAGRQGARRPRAARRRPARPTHVRLDVDGLGTVEAPLRDRRRRDVVAAAQAARAGRRPATWASGTPSASTSATSTGPASRRLWVWFEPDLLPGYAWSFPLPDGRANVGFGVLRGRRRRIQDMKAMWPELLARPHVRAVLGPDAAARGAPQGLAHPGPHRPGACSAHGRALFVGDAAGRHRPAHRRGHRPGPADRRAGRRRRRRLPAPTDRRRPRPATRRPCAASWSPTTACRPLLGRVLSHTLGWRAARCASPALTPWTSGAASGAGSSRTSPAPRRSPPPLAPAVPRPSRRLRLIRPGSPRDHAARRQTPATLACDNVSHFVQGGSPPGHRGETSASYGLGCPGAPRVVPVQTARPPHRHPPGGVAAPFFLPARCGHAHATRPSSSRSSTPSCWPAWAASRTTAWPPPSPRRAASGASARRP